MAAGAPATPAVWRSVLAGLVGRREVLRTGFEAAGGEPVQVGGTGER